MTLVAVLSIVMRFPSTSGASYTMLVISAGYFLHDAVTCIRNYEDWGFAYLVHAISCCVLYRCCAHLCISKGPYPTVYYGWLLTLDCTLTSGS